MEKSEPQLECLKVTCNVCAYGKKFECSTRVKSEAYYLQYPNHYECRRKSPELTLKNECEDVTSWPMVKPTDFCGDFKCKS